MRRPLLILHGTNDDNVYFAHSLKLADALDEAGASSAAGALEMLGSAGAARALELSLDPATIELLNVAKAAAELERENEKLKKSTQKVNEQFKQLPSGFKLRAAVFQSLTGIEREGAAGVTAPVLGPSLFEQERAQEQQNLAKLGLAPGGGLKANIVIEEMTVVAQDAEALAGELGVIGERGRLVRSGIGAGIATASAPAFAGST